MGRVKDLKRAPEPAPAPVRSRPPAGVVMGSNQPKSHQCPACSDAFPSEVDLLHHFRDNHTRRSKKGSDMDGAGLLSSSDEDEDDDSDSDKENDLKEEEGEPPDPLNFLTDRERALLAEPVFPLDEEEVEEEEGHTDPEQGQDDEDIFEEWISEVIAPPSSPAPSSASSLSPPSLPRRRSKRLASSSSSSGQSDDWLVREDGLRVLVDPPASPVKKSGRPSRVAVEDEMFECVFCWRGYPSQELLTSHLRAHTLEEPFFCKLCQDCFGQKEELTKHVREQHPENGGALPSRDSKRSSPETEVTISRKVKKLDFNVMDEARKKYQALVALRRLGKAVPSVPAKFRCPLCKKGFNLMAEIEEHMTKIHQKKKEERKLIMCGYCKIRFYWKCNLAIHTRKFHSCLVVLDGGDRDRLGKQYNLRERKPAKRVRFKAKDKGL